MTPSRALRKLRGGDFVRVACLNRVTDPWMAEVVGALGFDVIWLDLEHRTFSADVMNTVSLACRARGIDLMVRIRKTGYDGVMRALEAGANGIMVPHCRSAEEARAWVEAARFPPLGRRGFDGAGADADFLLASPLEHIEHANRETFLVLQIEDREAVECVEEIAAVPGFDLLFVGPGDLTISYGVPMQLAHPEVQGAIDRIAAAAAASGKFWGMATGSPAIAQDAIDRGAALVTCGSDHCILVEGFRAAARDFSGLSRRSRTEA